MTVHHLTSMCYYTSIIVHRCDEVTDQGKHMARVRMLLSLPSLDYDRLSQAAARHRTLPATLAARLIANALVDTVDDDKARGPFQALSEWLAQRLDLVHARQEWLSDITVSVFEMIEDEAIALYKAAESELGRTALNQSIARIVRTRLGAAVLRRDDRPHIARVPRGRTVLIKTYTLLRPAHD